MKYILILFLFSNISFAQEHRYSIDSMGYRINPAKLPSQIEKRIVKLERMDLNESVQVAAQAMVVDKEGGCWLDPSYIAYPLKTKGDLEVIRNELGYIVRVNYNYYKTERGFSIPYNPKWSRGYVPAGFIPVKGIVVIKPVYDKPSYFRNLTKGLQQPYNPRFQRQIIENPYSLEN